MNNIYSSKHNSAIFCQKVALLVVPIASYIAQASQVSAQIVPATIQGTATEVDAVGGQYDINGGQTSEDGKNLFHSFEQFDLNAGETANFVTTNANTQSIIGSINGGNPSTINGTLQVSGSDADLYLMNPAGILFGPQVQLNLSGGIIATTAEGMDFANEQLIGGESADYKRFVGAPTSLRFTEAKAGAVVNLGDLAVDSGQSISLVGGAVVNTGNLEAPGGAVTVAAVEGKNLVQLSQEGHLLSLEVIADETIANSSLGISPASISEMLTGKGFTGATTLQIAADGTVQLGSTGEAISGGDGGVTLSGSLSTAGKSGGTVEVLGKQLSLESAVIEASENSNDGLIRFGAEDIVVTDLVTPTRSEEVTYLSSSYVEGLSERGKLDISATNDLLIEEVYNDELIFERGASVVLTADSDKDLEGRFDMQIVRDPANADRVISQIRAESGQIEISGAGITAGAIRTDTTGQKGQGGGGITLSSDRGIDVNSVSSNAYFSGNDAGDGGNVRIEAGEEGISIREGIKTWSYSDGGNKSGKGGDVDLMADGDIVVGEINSVSQSGKNSSGSGGRIALASRMGSVTVNGDISSGSLAEKNNASEGGSVMIEANDDIEIRGAIDTSSKAENSNTDNAGSVSLIAGDRILVNAIDATSSGKGQDGDIAFVGDSIDLLGGIRSVSGQLLSFQPASVKQNINIGTSTNADSELDISATDLAAIKSVERIDIGRADGTGRISLFLEDTTTTSSLLPIYITGGGTLVGSDAGSAWTINGSNKGLVDEFFFENFGSLEGGAGKDTFVFEEDGFLSGSVIGGDGVDTIDFTSSKVAAADINFFDIEEVVGGLTAPEPTYRRPRYPEPTDTRRPRCLWKDKGRR